MMTEKKVSPPRRKLPLENDNKLAIAQLILVWLTKNNGHHLQHLGQNLRGSPFISPLPIFLHSAQKKMTPPYKIHKIDPSALTTQPIHKL